MRNARGHVSRRQPMGRRLTARCPAEEVPPVSVPAAPPSGSAARDVLRARPPPLPGTLRGKENLLLLRKA
ncbi:unnamed protein product [Coccothraustes coccothraustes]